MKTIIIAEAGVNHNGNIKLALRMVDIAAKSKADFIKFQTYSTDDLVQENFGLAGYQKKTVKNIFKQKQLLKKYELSKKDHLIIIKRCREKKIKFMSSPFDLKSINLLKHLKLKTIKIPSGEITNIPYLEKLGQLKRNIILSTGMANLQEIKIAIKILINCGTKKKNITVLHCSTEYPANIKKLNLLSIRYLKKKLNMKIGYSDHSLGYEASLIAVAFGAEVLEKHFTTNKILKGPDHNASLSPKELYEYISKIRIFEKSFGKMIKLPYKTEITNSHFVRKNIVTLKAIKKGEIFSSKNITTKRSKPGLPSSKWKLVLGKKSKFNFKEDENVKI
jgi:N,N'-diacetyllegionaminate synthase